MYYTLLYNLQSKNSQSNCSHQLLAWVAYRIPIGFATRMFFLIMLILCCVTTLSSFQMSDYCCYSVPNRTELRNYSTNPFGSSGACKFVHRFCFLHERKTFLVTQLKQNMMNHDSGFIIGIAMIFCQNSNRTYT